MLYAEAALQRCSYKICSKFSGKQPCQNAISIRLQSNFTEITLQHGCSPVNSVKFPHIFRTPFPRNASGGLLLYMQISWRDFQSLHLFFETLRVCWFIWKYIFDQFQIILTWFFNLPTRAMKTKQDQSLWNKNVEMCFKNIGIYMRLSTIFDQNPMETLQKSQKLHKIE